jgi:hypothetical protein
MKARKGHFLVGFAPSTWIPIPFPDTVSLAISG